MEYTGGSKDRELEQMEWLTSIRKAIDYMETHLEEDITAQDVADQVFMSPFFFQKAFSLLTGYGIGEYIRSRRLHQAAIDLRETDDKVIDIALRYCYETPESFSKAFSRFHGASPSQVRDGAAGKSFLPLTITISIQGGNRMDCKITPMPAFKVIGFQRLFDTETAYQEIPKFWNEVSGKYMKALWEGKSPANPAEQAVMDNCIGEYGISIDDAGGGKFRYLIAGKYKGGDVPEGMTVHEFPRNDWAVFDCRGPLPGALQSVNTRIFKEWIPGNPDYEVAAYASVEWYDGPGDTSAPDYHSAVWIPVRKKQA